MAYPILNLRQQGIGARAYVEGLEDVVIATLGHFGISAQVRLNRSGSLRIAVRNPFPPSPPPTPLRGVSLLKSKKTTFHGPGQLVAYLVLNLRQLRIEARA